MYLSCEAARFPIAAPEPCEIQFEDYATTQRGRLIRLVERTYDGTLDCTALNGVRDLDDVVNGYQNTGTFRAENWQFVRRDGEDIGVLLLADHPQARTLGIDVHGARALKFEGAVGAGKLRGMRSGWRVVLRLSGLWWPSTRRIRRPPTMYRSSGFELWDHRTVYCAISRKVSQLSVHDFADCTLFCGIIYGEIV